SSVLITCRYDSPRMVRTWWTAFTALWVTIAAGSSVIAVATVRSTSGLIDRLIRWWARTLVHAAGIELSLEGGQRIDPAQRYTLIANHYSYFDIPCVLASVQQPIRFLAKVSLFKIPIFGWAIGRAGLLQIDRT